MTSLITLVVFVLIGRAIFAKRPKAGKSSKGLAVVGYGLLVALPVFFLLAELSNLASPDINGDAKAFSLFPVLFGSVIWVPMLVVGIRGLRRLRSGDDTTSETQFGTGRCPHCRAVTVTGGLCANCAAELHGAGKCVTCGAIITNGPFCSQCGSRNEA